MGKYFKQTSWMFWLVIILEVMPSGCAERYGEAVILPDSTFIYRPVNNDDIVAKITLSSRYSQKTGKQSAVRTVFSLKENEDVYAVVDLENRTQQIGKFLMFHIDWIDPDGRSVFMKRIDNAPGDSTRSLVSFISASPDKRFPGKYMVRVFLFRELIAVKHFSLIPEEESEKVKANITFYKSIDKESGRMIGVDTVFQIKKKGILRVQVDLIHPGIYKDDWLPLRMEWISPDGSIFFDKKIDYVPGDPLSIIGSSISIAPGKREPGEYLLRAYLFYDMIGERKFVLLP